MLTHLAVLHQRHVLRAGGAEQLQHRKRGRVVLQRGLEVAPAVGRIALLPLLQLATETWDKHGLAREGWEGKGMRSAKWCGAAGAQTAWGGWGVDQVAWWDQGEGKEATTALGHCCAHKE